MSDSNIGEQVGEHLQVLLVEDNPGDLQRLCRDLPAAFTEHGVKATIHPVDRFDRGLEMVRDPSRRFDLILSDTYRGEHGKGDAAVLEMVQEYRAGRFAPLVVFSTGVQPPALTVGAFVLWADKAEPHGIEDAIEKLLRTGVPQAARHLCDEIDRRAGSFLWEFLESNWLRLQADGCAEPLVLDRLIRRRAALQIAEMAGAGQGSLEEVQGLEYYIYPPLDEKALNLGQVLRHKQFRDDWRVILTPHCFIASQDGKPPRAEFVRVVKAIPIKKVINPESIEQAKPKTEAERIKSFAKWTRLPSKVPVGLLEGRYWYLPRLLDIPHMYCDLLQTDSLPYHQVVNDFDSIAVLSSPYGESLQASSQAFNGSVGIPRLSHSSLKSLLD